MSRASTQNGHFCRLGTVSPHTGPFGALPFQGGWHDGTVVNLTDVATALADKRAQLEVQLAEMSAPPEELGTISFGKRVGEGTSQAVDRLSAVPAHDKLQTMLAEITRAQHKITEGSYGVCDVCARPIGSGRLEARPWATHCIDHA